MDVVVAVIGIAVLVMAVRQARAKGAAASMQAGALGFLLLGAAATGLPKFLTGLVLDPLAWLGFGMLAVSGAMFLGGQALEKPRKGKEINESPRQVESSKRKPAKSKDGDEDSDVNDILKKYGIE